MASRGLSRKKIFAKRGIPGPVGPTGSVGGTGNAPEVAVWAGLTTLTGFSDFVYDNAGGLFSITFPTVQTQILLDELNAQAYFQGGSGYLNLTSTNVDLQSNQLVSLGDAASLGNNTIIEINDSVETILISATNGVTVDNLAGAGTRMVTCDNTGLLGSLGIPSGVTPFPTGEVVFGTGTGITSSPNFIYTIATGAYNISDSIVYNFPAGPHLFLGGTQDPRTGVPTADYVYINANIDTYINSGTNITLYADNGVSNGNINLYSGTISIGTGPLSFVSYVFPATQGAAGEVLTNDGAGNLSWDPVPSALALETDGTPNGDQTILNLVAGTNVNLTDSGTGNVTIDVAIPINPVFETDGVTNPEQDLLNLVAGSNIVLTDDGAGNITIDSTGSGGLSSLPTDNVLYVMKNGNNGTGTINRLDLPYLTINAAKAAASAGDTIVVYPGDYVETGSISLSNGINYQFLGVGTLTHSSGSKLFQGVSNSTVRIFAPGWSFFTTGINDVMLLDSGLGLTNINLSFTFREVSSVSGFNFVLNPSASNIYLTGDYAYCDDGDANIIGYSSLNGSNVHVNIKKFYSQNNTTARNVDLQKGNFFLTSQQMRSGGGAIYVQASNANCKMFFDVQEVNCTGGVWPVWFAGTSTNMGFRCTRLVGASDCLLVNQNGGTLFATVESIHCNYVGTVDGIVHAEAATMYLNNATITRGVSAVNGGDIKTSATAPSLYLKGVSYDVTKQVVGAASEVKTWNGSTWVNAPFVQNNPAGSLNTITNCNLEGCTINFATFTGCTLSNIEAKNHTFTFGSNGQTITNQMWFNATQLV